MGTFRLLHGDILSVVCGEKVELELVCIGYNLRKYHNRKIAKNMN